MLNHPPHLDKNNPKKLASHYEQTACNTFKQAKVRLEDSFNSHAPILEDDHAEAILASELEKLVNIQDVFEITEELRKKIMAAVDHTLYNC